jgi:hypothetical protein
MKRSTLFTLAAGSLAVAGAAAACDSATEPGRRVEFQSRSATPALLKNLAAGVEAFPLISSDDAVEGSPGFVFGGSADGMGLMRNTTDGSYTLLVNHEDNFSVSRLTLDREFRPTTADYAIQSQWGRFRLCSATLAKPEVHGFGPLYITAGESNAESQIHGMDPFAPANSSRMLTALGRWNTENAVPLPRQAYGDRTVIVIGDDDSGSAAGGQLALYVGTGIGDLDNGSVYVMARANDVVRERDMVPGQAYPVVFRKVEGAAGMTGADINARSLELKAIQFGRVEDIDYRKGSGGGREVYFNVTGQNNTGTNADYARSKYGRVYRLVLDPKDPTRGTVEVLLDGDDRAGPAREFQNPDNILVTRNYAYIAEDPNGYGDETHDARVYQYDLRSGAMTVVAELDHRRGDARYNNVPGAQSALGSWEFGAMLDLEEEAGIRGGFLLAIQPHTWTGDRYKAPDGGTGRPNEAQASQLVVLTGLPR